MQPFNKLAGVEEATNIQNHPPPPPIPDLESQATHSLHSRPSRASLPVNRKPSRRTLHEQSSRNSLRPPSLHPSLLPPSAGWQGIPNGDYTASAHSHDTQLEDELPWGPSHPCFPHLNPHVAIASPLYSSTRVIRVQRDWLVAGDLYPALQNLYPEILDQWLSESDFRTVVETLNPMLKQVFEPNTWGSWFDALMGVATGFLWDNFGWTGVKRGVRDMEKWVEGWNTEAEREGRE
ncbi:hypothetical protein D6D27_00893, partial [Aureobasidium pullulans]